MCDRNCVLWGINSPVINLSWFYVLLVTLSITFNIRAILFFLMLLRTAYWRRTIVSEYFRAEYIAQLAVGSTTFSETWEFSDGVSGLYALILICLLVGVTSSRCFENMDLYQKSKTYIPLLKKFAGCWSCFQ